MEDLMLQMAETAHAIQRTEANFKKISKATLSLATAKSRLVLLDQRWNRCEELHWKLTAAVAPAAHEKVDYFKNNDFLLLEEKYLQAHDYVVNQIDMLTPRQANPDVSNQSGSTRVNHPSVKLPEISILDFSGDFCEWENFRDLFDTLIIQIVRCQMYRGSII